MYRLIALCLSTISIGLICGCAMFSKPEPPPPLPPIEEPKPPPLKMKSDYFKAFPWGELAKPSKDGNDKDSKLYTIKEKDTFESIALKQMGDKRLGRFLATYNQMSQDDAKPGEKIVIPNPIIGMSCQLQVKVKGKKRFGDPQPFDIELKKGDQYRLCFESNITGHAYVFRQGAKGIRMLYPSRLKKGRRNRGKENLMRQPSKVTAHEEFLVPSGNVGFRADPRKVGDKIFVFLSLRRIAELEDLSLKKTIRMTQLEDVTQRVKEGEIFSEAPYWLLRISDPDEILHFVVDLNG